MLLGRHGWPEGLHSPAVGAGATRPPVGGADEVSVAADAAPMDQLRALLPSLRAAVTSNAATAPGLLSQCKVLLIELPSAVSSAAPSEEELALSRACGPKRMALPRMAPPHCPTQARALTPPPLFHALPLPLHPAWPARRGAGAVRHARHPGRGLAHL